MHKEERVHWIDIARGFFIIAIVWGHIFNDGYLRWWLFSFHVPAFFFISGFCFKYKLDCYQYIRQKIRTIVIPYFVFSIVSILLIATAAIVSPQLVTILECNPFINLIVMIYGNSKPDIMKYNTPLWFLTCFFCVSIMGYIVEKLERKKKIFRLIVALLCIFLGVFVSTHEDIALPWHIETAFSMLVWYLCGIYIQESWHVLSVSFSKIKLHSIWKYFFALALITIGYVVSLLNVRVVGVRNEHYGILPIYYCAAFLGIVGFLYLSIIINKNRLLEFIGKNSLGILVLHKFPILFFQEVFPLTRKMLEQPNTFQGFGCGVIVLIMTLVLALIGGRTIEKIFPWMLGRRKNGL